MAPTVHSPDGDISRRLLLIGSIHCRSLLCCMKRKPGGCTCAACVCACVWVCERHKHSDKAVIPVLNSTKAGPASVASPPVRGETNNKKREREKEANFQHKEKRKHLPCCYVHSFTPFLFSLKRGKYRGGKMITWKKLEEKEKEGNERSQNKTAATGCQHDLFIKPILPLSLSLSPIHMIHPFSTVTPKHHTTKSVRKVTCPLPLPPRPLAHAASSHQTARCPGSVRERQTGDHVVADDWLSPLTLITVNVPHIRYQWG